MQGDNEGNNVSQLNPFINEHTIIYWVGQHLNQITDDYIGFCHYRRYFDVPENEQITPNTIYVNQMKFGISNALYFLLNHDPDVSRAFAEFIQKYMRIMDKQSVNYLISFLNSDILYSGNMFIMHRDQFKQYIKLITPIYNIIFNMIYPFPNVANRAASFILERVTSFIIIYMINTNKNLELKQGNYIKLGDIVT